MSKKKVSIDYQELALRVKPYLEEIKKRKPLALEFTLSSMRGGSHEFIQSLWEEIDKQKKIVKKNEWVSVGVILAVMEDIIVEGTFAGKLQNIIYTQIEAEYRKENSIGDYPPEVQSPYLQFPEVYSNIRIDTWDKLEAMGYRRS